MPVKPDIKAAEAIASSIDKAVQRALDIIGVATKQDIKALDARIEKLEAAGAVPIKRKPGRPPGSKNKKKAAKKPRVGKPAAKKASA